MHEASDQAGSENWQFRMSCGCLRHFSVGYIFSAWPAYSPDLSPIEHVWDALDTTLVRYVYDSVFQFLPISSNFAQPLKRNRPTFHRPQSATWSTLYEGDVRQIVVTPDTDWFSEPPNNAKLHISEWPFIVASLTVHESCCLISILICQTCEVGWIISAKEKGSLTQI